ncbi:MAG: hypothetical protein AAFM91_07890 [Pseudomonadota bacterium]
MESKWFRLAALASVVVLAACDGRIYTRGGVTDGDTFYVAEYAYFDEDPVTQAWLAYSLDLSACQLMIGGDNPARNSSYDCELGAREALDQEWRERRALDSTAADRYLDAHNRVVEAGWLREYVAVELRRDDWELPDDLDTNAYRDWRRDNLRGHRPMQRLLGSWNYRDR